MRHSGVPFRNMWGGKSNQQWVSQYATSHQHPMNRVCHTFGIPIIVVSLALFVASIFTLSTRS